MAPSPATDRHRPPAVALWCACLALLSSAGPVHAQEAADAAPGRRIALVIGVSTYPHLPATLGLESARSDAARVAAALQNDAGFDEVRLLTDASASLGGVEAVLREQLSREVQWRDLLLVYFVGHGVGGDFGDPRLLLYDADPNALEATTLSVGDFTSLLTRFVPASHYVLVTDAAHAGTVGGLALLGPTGNDWPSLGSQSVVLSSSGPRQVAVPGVFATAFVEAMAGHGDLDADGAVTATELNHYLVVAVGGATHGQQLPTVQSSYPPSLVLAQRRPTPAVVPGLRVDKAKFVVVGGSGATVSCQGMSSPRACDPACYVWDVPTGPCRVAVATSAGELSAQVSLVARGGYTCTVVGTTLQCAPSPGSR